MTKELEDIKDYSDVCKKLCIKELTEVSFHHVPMSQRKKLLAAHKIMNIARLFNGDWEVNWEDGSQRKWYPYFEYEAGPGWCFFYSNYRDAYSSAQVAFYKDENTSNHCGRLFISIYKDFLN